MSEACLLFIPKELFHNCVLPHLTVHELQSLDNACTNKQLRPYIQEIWQSYTHTPPHDDAPMPQLRWFAKNGISCNRISVQLSDDTVVSVLALISAHFPMVKELVVRDDLDTSSVSLNWPVQVAHSFPQLEMLCIESSAEFNCTGIVDLASQCKYLHTISLAGAVASDDTVQLLCATCAHLLHISLVECENLTDVSVIAIADAYPMLQSIKLEGCNVTDDGVLALAANCHVLQSIALRYLDKITSTALASLWTANPALIEIDIEGHDTVTDRNFATLCNMRPTLRVLNLSCCGQLTDAAIIAVAEHCPNFTSIDIGYCAYVADASLIALGQHSHALKYVNISSSRNITDAGIAALAAGCPLLQKFKAHDNNFSDAGVIALARGCRNLRVVHLCLYKAASSFAISTLAELCPMLSELRLPYNNVDDACLHAIAKHCRNLTILSVHNNDRISLSGVQAVIKSCCQLQKINVVACRGIDKQTLIRWQKKYFSHLVLY